MNPDKHYDAIVIGGGPAGLTTGIYLSRARMKTAEYKKEEKQLISD